MLQKECFPFLLHFPPSICNNRSDCSIITVYSELSSFGIFYSSEINCTFHLQSQFILQHFICEEVNLDEEHLKHVKIILDKLTDACFSVNPEKCSFACSSIKLLGHNISKDGLSLDASKLMKLDNFKRPTTGNQVESFLGFINYF
jgi:hypothetical protein